MKRATSISVLLILLLPVALSAADSGANAAERASFDWPQWRGPNRDARSAETGLLHEWAEGGPEVLWRVDIGDGYSGVAVAGGRLYTMSDEGDRQFLLCLDARTGKELWRRQLGAAFEHPYGNGPRSTPLVSGGAVFAIGTDGLLLAADAETGKTRWQHDLVEKLGARLPGYGYASSPLVVGGRLFVEAGGKNAAYAAFDRATGKLLWRSLDDSPAYTSPLRVSIAGVDQIVFWSARGVHAVSPGSGAELWSFPWETNCPVSGDPLGTATPIFVAPDTLFLSSRSGAALIRISRSQGGTFGVESVWRSETFRNDVNSSVLIGDHIYGFDGGIFKCIDARTGEVQWKARGFQKGSLIAADGQLIVLGERGNLALVDANPNAFTQRDTARLLEGRNWTAPALAAGRLYLRNHDELVCVNMLPSE